MTDKEKIADAANNMENKYIKNIPENFWFLRFLDQYMQGHKGFIAGGCFKNILSREKVKDVDIFFHNQSDFDEAVAHFNSLVEEGTWTFKYRNNKACAFQEKGSSMWVELIESVFGTPEDILNNFDFTITKFAYYKEIVPDNVTSMPADESEDFPFDDSDDKWHWEYMLLYHRDFFEHLHQKRLVLDNKIPFPISTWERSYRYKGYGYNLCRESKKKLLDAIRNITPKDDELSMYDIGGWD